MTAKTIRFALVLLALHSSLALAADPKPKAYVIVGYTQPKKDFLDEKEWFEKTANAAKKQLEDAGYDVTVKLTATSQDFIAAADDPDARALVFIDHGLGDKPGLVFPTGGGKEYVAPENLTGNNYDRFKIVTFHACTQDRQEWKDKFSKAKFHGWKGCETPARVLEWQKENTYPVYPEPTTSSNSSLKMSEKLETDTIVTVAVNGEDALVPTHPIGDWTMAPALASAFGSRSFNYFILSDDLSTSTLIFSATVEEGRITETDLEDVDAAADFDVSLTYSTWLAAVQNPDILLSPGIIGSGASVIDHTGGSLDEDIAWEGFRRTVFFVPAPDDVDHFQCYEVDDAVFTRAGLSLEDRIGPSTVDVIRPKRLCNPANKQDEDPSAPSHPEHLVGYDIKQIQPRFIPIKGVQVSDQFGTLTLALRRAETLLVPTAKSLTEPPLPFTNPGVDHFKCYRARGKLRVPALTVVDQFGTLIIDVKKPFRLCMAADKESEGIVDPDANLLCYKVRVAAGQAPFRGPTVPVFVSNQFQDDAFHVNHLRELCVPAVVILPGPTPTPTGP